MRRFELSDRVLGSYDAGLPGPMVIACSATHGNEPAGVEAALSVLAQLREAELPLRGRFVGIVGHMRALREGLRFIDEDLNRRWRTQQVDAVMFADPKTLAPEEVEQRAMVELFEQLMSEAEGPVVYLDLHSTSGRGAPFAICAQTPGSRALARQLAVPVISGLDRMIPGTVLDYWRARNAVAVGIEGGPHADPRTVAYLEGTLWMALVNVLALHESDVPHYWRHRALLMSAASDLPGIVEVFHRHPVLADDGFTMEPGYFNFQAVDQGELLARDRRGEIRAVSAGHLLLPRYQDEGDDGFFLGRAVPD